ncbi:hypothetical protein GE09DRAFT_1272654 [Coniochaeta sp. 2T2.1]|nr:hypothetical protein GE09DRAFT_1272654 [Coniochaeta sp. 2T2.1]
MLVQVSAIHVRSKDKLPSGKSLSIAAPASYWYLKEFPIGEMSKQVDYIVFMTYDLHGQWDYSNKWIQEDCAAGNRLPSHVNLTETMYTLAMSPGSGATPGECTATGGYISNAEIDEILNLNSSDTVYKFDQGSDSDIVFYGNNWVS